MPEPQIPLSPIEKRPELADFAKASKPHFLNDDQIHEAYAAAVRSIMSDPVRKAKYDEFHKLWKKDPEAAVDMLMEYNPE